MTSKAVPGNAPATAGGPADSSPADSSPADSSPASIGSGTHRWFLVLLLMICALVLSKNYADPDLWGHVQYGRDALREGLPQTTTYSYTAEDYRWINHENLSELCLAAGADLLGSTGLLLLKCAAGLVICGLALVRIRKQVDSAVGGSVLLLLVALSLMHFWSVRPQVFSYVLFTLMILVLDRCFAGWPSVTTVRNSAEPPRMPPRTHLLWLLALPLLLCLWANTHGAFVAGFCILAAYLGGRGLEAVWLWRGRSAWLLAASAATLIASGLATWLNPYGWELHRWLLHSLGSPRPEIIEWRAPELFSLAWAPWWMLVAVFLLAVVGSRRPRDLTQLLLLFVTLWQACEHRRHIPFFAILCGLWLAPQLGSALRRWNVFSRGWEFVASGPQRTAIHLALGIATLLVGANLVGQLRAIPVRKDDYPVAAFQYIADQQLQGRLVVRFRWAQYAIAAFGSQPEDRQLRVAFDGRFRTCYPQQVVDMYFDFAVGNDGVEPRHRDPDSLPFQPDRILRVGPPDLVLVHREQPHSVQVMQQNQADWTLLYQDRVTQLWGRRQRYDDPQSPHYLPLDRRDISERPQEGFVCWPALPSRSSSPIEQLARNKQSPPGARNLVFRLPPDRACTRVRDGLYSKSAVQSRGTFGYLPEFGWLAFLPAAIGA